MSIPGVGVQAMIYGIILGPFTSDLNQINSDPRLVYFLGRIPQNSLLLKTRKQKMSDQSPEHSSSRQSLVLNRIESRTCYDLRYLVLIRSAAP